MIPHSAPAETPLARKLAARMRTGGPMAFADYMEACLYDPQHGYYSVDRHAAHGDYFTSVEFGPIFGQLLARQLDEIWRALDQPGELVIAELGAGDGALAQQILDFSAARFPDFYAALRYVAIERSAARREAQAARLGPHLRTGRATSTAQLPRSIAAGCVLSNEFFDALPTHRVVMAGGELQEIFVGHDGRQFVESLGPPSEGIAEYFARQGVTLRQSQQAEACLAACAWIEALGASLECGLVLTVDYGHDAAELYNERHMRGTLLAYSGKRSGEDCYRAPGEQDLTAHVNFSALELWGRGVGLEPAGRVSQMQFLLALARESGFEDFQADQETARVESRLQLKTLIHPEGMGETFQVEIQKKGMGEVRLTGLLPL